MAVDRPRFDRVLRSGGAGSSGPDQAGCYPADDPLSNGAGEPVDMAQVRADDAFVDALAKANRAPAADPLDERMASLLLSWRDDVSDEPSRPLLDVATAAATIRNAPRPVDRQLFGPLAAAAAALIIAFTGLGLAAHDAEPGDTLFGVTKVLYSDKARSAEAAFVVRTKLEVASAALASGRVAEAQDAIEQAQEELIVVAPEDGQGDLAARTEELMDELSRLTPTPSQATTTPAAVQPSAVAPTVTPSPAPKVAPTETTPPPPPPSPTTVQPTVEPSTGAPAPGGETGGDGTTPGDSPGDALPEETLDGSEPTT